MEKWIIYSQKFISTCIFIHIAIICVNTLHAQKREICTHFMISGVYKKFVVFCCVHYEICYGCRSLSSVFDILNLQYVGKKKLTDSWRKSVCMVVKGSLCRLSPLVCCRQSGRIKNEHFRLNFFISLLFFCLLV